MKISSPVVVVDDRRRFFPVPYSEHVKESVASVFRKVATVIDRRYRGTLGLLICALLLTACGSKLTEDNLQKIHNGMTTVEVKNILGEPTSSQTGSALGLISGTTYLYHTATSDVKITFLNDQVIATEGEFK